MRCIQNIQMSCGVFCEQEIGFEKLCYHSPMSNIEIEQSIKVARALLDQGKGLSPAFRAAMRVMFMAVSILLERVNLNSNNSSKPPFPDSKQAKTLYLAIIIARYFCNKHGFFGKKPHNLFL